VTGFTLPEAYDEIREEALAVAATVEPYAVDADSSSVLDERVHLALSESGLYGFAVPAAFGGRAAEVDPVAVCVIREVLMATSSHLDALFALQGIGSYAIAQAGSPELQEQWLPRVASGEAIAALALTEPEAGSDLKAVTTTLTTVDGRLEISGEKSFISNAGSAAFYTVLAREDDGFSLVVVPADAPGVSVSPTPELIAPHLLGDLKLDRIQVAESSRVGERGFGFQHVLATLAVFRASVAAAAVGLAGAALKEAVAHASNREQFGRPLMRIGAVGALLADSWAELEAARLLTYRAATLARSDPASSLAQSSMAKLFATETAGRVVDRCVQVMGRFGLIRDSKIERLYRQARPMRIYEGSSEVLRAALAKDLAKAVASEEWLLGQRVPQ
jgi:acyl-CoA dehydrogenase